MRKISTILFVSLMMVSSQLLAATNVPAHMPKGFDITEDMGYLIDPTSQLQITDIASASNQSTFAPLPKRWQTGFSKDAYWMKFTLRFNNPLEDEYWLEVSPAILDDVTLYSQSPNGQWQALKLGDHEDVGHRPILYRNFIFPIKLGENSIEHTYYLRIQSTSTMYLNALLWKPVDFVSGRERPDSYIGAYFGVISLLALLALILWGWLKKAIVFYYAAFQITVCLVQAFMAGIIQINLPIPPLVADSIQKGSGSLFVAMSLFFFMFLFDTKKHSPRLYFLITISMFALLISGIIYASGLLPFNGHLASWMSITGISLMMIESCQYALRKPQPGKWFFLVSFWTTYPAIILGILRTMAIGNGPSLMGTPIIMNLMTTVLMTLGVIQVIRQAAKDKLQAKQDALDISQASEHQLNINVTERAQALAVANQLLTQEVAERQAAQLKLESALIAKRQLMAAQREFFAIAAHEFRTPLAIIDTTSQRLAETDLDETIIHHKSRIKPAMQKIRRATLRMRRLLDNFLASDKLESINSSAINEVHDLKDIVRACVRQYKQLTSRTIRIHTSDERPIPAHCDDYLISLLISNLIDNAIKYSPSEKAVEVEITTDEVHCYIEIRDEGIGIKAEDLEIIFKKYARVKGVESTPGSGLGLHVARSIAQLHHGDIEIKSEYGKGSSFRLILPKHVQENPE
ncbi:MAG: 7TM-DISM domain-containing protein [Methylophilaceae bacterium]